MRFSSVLPPPASVPVRLLVVAAFAAASALAMGCARAPADLREWKADDHDRPEDQQKGRPTPGRAAPPPRTTAAASTASADPNATLVEVAWRNQCSLCHGLTGKGDGPQGPMVKAQDLTRPEWQASVTDEQIVATIQNGKNRMPKFDFPPEVLRGLVARIRAAKGR